MTSKAREAAESIRRGIGGKYDREHERAVAAFTAFEAQIREECARVAASLAHLTDEDFAEADEEERIMHRHGHIIAAAIRGGGNG